jgi:DNA-binding transcriptional LysR family regulator
MAIRVRTKGNREKVPEPQVRVASPRGGSVDLNLLVYFDALFAEGQVSRAAQRVNLSQPAMSLALKRLRERFGDPLLVRTPHGMVPTARARELIGPVRKMLRQSRDLLEPRQSFDPRRSAGPFLLVATDYVSSLVLPGLIKRLEKEAPLAQVVARPANPEQLRRWFEEGKVDLGLGYTESPPPELRSKRLFDETLVCIARQRHSGIAGKLTIEQLSAFHHVQIRTMRKPRYAHLVEQELASRGLETQVGLIVSDFRIAPEVVGVSDMIAVVPERVARRAARQHALQILELPFELPKLPFSMVWHERTHRDAVCRWLRDVVVEVCSRL